MRERERVGGDTADTDRALNGTSVERVAVGGNSRVGHDAPANGADEVAWHLAGMQLSCVCVCVCARVLVKSNPSPSSQPLCAPWLIIVNFVMELTYPRRNFQIRRPLHQTISESVFSLALVSVVALVSVFVSVGVSVQWWHRYNVSLYL